MKKICIIGAFDRYNYGDILFPIIIKRIVEDKYRNLLEKYSISFYSLSDADLTDVKGVKTKNIKALRNELKTNDNLVIISGGDVLPVRIIWALSDLIETNFAKFILKLSIKIFGVDFNEKIMVKYLKLDSKFPWIIKKNYGNQIFYNAVGGSTINKLSNDEKNIIRKLLQDADYISVRDNQSFENLRNLNIKCKKYPDSAIIISELFPLEYLETQISTNIKDLVKTTPNFICFQSNLYSAQGNEKIIGKQLSKLSEKTGLKLILLPIGVANNHNDIEALRLIQSNLEVISTLPENLNIYDIMYMIAKSNIFIGTSLHGNITALSFGIPHLGINKEISKLDYFLKTWDIEENPGCIDFNEITIKALNLLGVNQEKYLEKRSQLIQLVFENFDNIFKLESSN